MRSSCSSLGNSIGSVFVTRALTPLYMEIIQHFRVWERNNNYYYYFVSNHTPIKTCSWKLLRCMILSFEIIAGGELVERDGKKYKIFYGMSSTTAMKKHAGGVANYRCCWILCYELERSTKFIILVARFTSVKYVRTNFNIMLLVIL